MAVKIDKQSSLLGSPLTWFVLLAGVAGGVWYYLHRPKPEPVVAEVTPPPPPPVKKAPDFVDLPPPKEVPKEVLVIDDPSLRKPEEVVKPVEPDVPYSLLKNTRIVKVRLGKGPDALDRQMWEIDASPKKPYKWDKDLGKVLGPKLAEYMGKEARKTVAHPSSKEFPGAVPDDAPRIEKVVKVPLKTPRWFFTGMYAPPGEVIRIQTSSELKGAEVIIGCHRDNIATSKREQTHRFPIISNSHRIEKTTMEVANPFGGLIYINVPDKKEWVKSHSSARVEIEGAVEAPSFVLGVTTKEEWMRLRKAPAPWGEIGGALHCAAARSARFREMDFDTAKALAEYWDKAVELQDWLCGWDTRRSPERMVPDAEITAGSGHSGYPYMGYLDWEGWTDLKSITTNGAWGHFHEIGHNHQSGAWTFAGYGEVTNNVMALLCEERLAGLKVGEGQGWLGSLQGALATRLGPPPKEDARGNLAMYVPVIRAFGWESLRNTWAEYAKKGNRSGMNLTTDDKKKETFVLIWSKHCKANLGPYFETFGFPFTPSMRTRLGPLKKWMPPDFPPKPGTEDTGGGAIEDHGAQIGDYVTDS